MRPEDICMCPIMKNEVIINSPIECRTQKAYSNEE
jgi:hypothetical protein